ncbi:endo alpha-1,4 polygalactosaminidase [Gynuella sp.]|uniref:endo alpha-1,4 polygalactosaminidase n=1 Tax=Gynuella sp. TaxID=2969146 RepID=UPI003D143EA5
MTLKYFLLGMPVLVAVSFTSCQEINNVDEQTSDQTEDSSNQESSKDPSWYKPAVGVRWQWQLQKTLDINYNVDIYDIDLFDTSKETIATLQSTGKKVICYFSAGSYEDWRDDENQFNEADKGAKLDDWEGERWLDIRSSNVRRIMTKRLDLAKEKGCDGVEPDNMDGYQNNPGFNLTANDQLDYNRFIATESHQRLLSVGLKNDLDQVAKLVSYFDFSVNEQCFEYDECDLLKPFIDAGKPVLNAEYNSKYRNNTNTRNNLCNQSVNMQFSTLILPIALDDSYRDSCLTP